MEFHGHSCPGLVIGYKVCQLLAEEWHINSFKDQDLLCVTETDACGVDAIQYISGCTFGKGNLIYRPAGKSAFSFFDRQTGKRVRFVLQKSQEWPEDREGRQDLLLKAFPESLFSQKTPHYELPERARVFDSIECQVCGESTAEYAVRFNDGKKVCLDCSHEYSRRWFPYL